MTWRARATLLLREPLVHFMLAGTLVFALLSGRGPDPGERRIVVSEAVAARLADRWAQTYRRAPSADEIDGLIREWVKDQVYYREALRLGLDRDDEVVVRRMRSKMVAAASAEAEAADPTDAELEALLAADPARYAPEPALTFRQIYLGADSPAARAAAATALASGKLPAPAGPAPLPARFDTAPLSEIAAQFGDEFAAALRGLPPGKWSGPVGSGLGLHLVLLERRSTPPRPSLSAVRQSVTNDWRAAALRRAEDEGYRRLLGGYDVVIERPR